MKVKPHPVKGGELEVDLWANTHSVDLSQFNLKKMTVLEFDGKTIAPSKSPALFGHHSSGMLIFDVDEQPESFTIKITGIPAVEERVFEWV